MDTLEISWDNDLDAVVTGTGEVIDQEQIGAFEHNATPEEIMNAVSDLLKAQLGVELCVLADGSDLCSFTLKKG